MVINVVSGFLEQQKNRHSYGFLVPEFAWASERITFECSLPSGASSKSLFFFGVLLAAKSLLHPSLSLNSFFLFL